ncbi:MAG TPA: PHP domain-containing protein [Candidatus Cottocaccamicrobium excrementipullorum]|nr:PHP domain-containing protein [Candidatus Cottocaccamicrobium excrementipullorum]
MSSVDLHVHSNASDGTLSPTQVVNLAKEKGLSAIALTDHDTVKGIPEAVHAANQTGIELVPGIELSCMYEGCEIHILGLYINPNEADFAQAIEELAAVRARRNEEMLRRFNEGGFGITREELTAGNPDTVITRAHFARVLVEKGYASSMNQAFQKYLQYGGPYCMRKEKISPRRAMEILTKNHAFPSLAHIMQYKLGWSENEKLVSYLKDLGLKGLEIYHSSHNQGQIPRLTKLAKDYGLLPTGGSDFHGSNKPDIQIGIGRGNLNLPYTLLADIKKEMGR